MAERTDRGICGDRFTGAGTTLVCDLLADHNGWHRCQQPGGHDAHWGTVDDLPPAGAPAEPLPEETP